MSDTFATPNGTILCQNISKSYKLFFRKRHQLLEVGTGGLVRRHRLFYALKNISCEIKAGECLGIIGENGSGKSTLLKIIAGTTFPDHGEVWVKGRVSALLELGTGFHPELTGRQNTQLNAQFYGIYKEQLEDLERRVQDFSELREFFDQPLKTYSSGMNVRLGFSLATHVHPNILIIDEALAVGDAYFQQKCIKKIKEFIASGVTCLFVSHDPSLVKHLCSKAILLHRGEKLEEGRPKTILDVYNGLISQHQQEIQYEIRPEREGREGGVKHGNHKVRIESAHLLGKSAEKNRFFEYDEEIKIRVICSATQAVPQCCVGILIKDVYGLEVFGTNTLLRHQHLSFTKAGQRALIDFQVRLNCGPGKYFVSVAAHLAETHLEETFDWQDNLLQFDVVAPKERLFTGRTYLKHEIQIEPL